jgi:hypothetical protein
MHLNSGVVEIPDDPSLVLNLVTENSKLEKYRIPEDEIQALVRDAKEEGAVSSYGQTEEAPPRA